MTIKLIVRVINSAGFKIPFFSLAVVVAAHNDNDISNCAITTLNAISSTTQSGEDYFLPDAMVERRFAYSVSCLSAVDLVVRIRYPNLTREPDMGNFHVPGDTKTPKRRQRSASSAQPPLDTFTAEVIINYHHQLSSSIIIINY